MAVTDGTEVKLDGSIPTTSVTFRFPDGTRKTQKFNVSATVQVPDTCGRIIHVLGRR